MDDTLAEMKSLIAQYRQHLDMHREFGVREVPRTIPCVQPAAAQRAVSQPNHTSAGTSHAPAEASRQEPPTRQPIRYNPPAKPRQPQHQPTDYEPQQQTVRSGRPSQPAAYRYQDTPEGVLSPDIPPALAIPSNDILAELRAEVSACEKCPLCESRKNVVFGEGDPETDLVFVGEGPGADEDIHGRPFVGRAGVLLTKIIQDGMKLDRHKVFICNVVKCRPPGNRVPNPTEMAGCLPYLKQQLQIIRPKVIVALGATATQGLLGEKVAITKLRGQFQDWNGIALMPTFHPAYLLRNYTKEARGLVFEDVKNVLKYLKEQGSTLQPKA